MDSDDFYEFLEIQLTSSLSQIRKAYRKKALILHPDKNPENPLAKSQFEKLSKILDILSDPAAREEYDKKLLARKRHQERNAELDAKRRKLRDELQEKERKDKEDKERKIMEDITRLREAERTRIANLRLLETENDRLKMKIKQDLVNIVEGSNEILYHILVEWEFKYEVTPVALKNIFSRFGEVDVVLTPKSSHATIIFKSKDSVLRVINERFDHLTLKGLQVVIQSRPEQTPYGPKCDQSFNDFEEEVLNKLRLTSQHQYVNQHMADASLY